MKRLALVTGATGVLGPTLARALIREGWTVRALCRQAPGPGVLPQDVEVREGDITHPEDVAAAVEGVSTVFHLAALLHESRPDSSAIPLYERINVGGTRNIVRAVAGQRAAVVFFSSIVVYGATNGRPVDESAPVRPFGPYAKTKRRAEEVLLDSGLPVTVLRLAAVYGRRMKGNYRRLADALRRRRFVPVGDGENRRTLIHERDVVRAALLAADHPEAPGHVFNVTDGEIHPMHRIIAAICAALGRPEPRWHIPKALARLTAGAADLASSALGRRGCYSDLVDKYLESVEVEGKKVQKRLGFRLSLDLESGWRDAIAGSSEAGQ